MKKNLLLLAIILFSFSGYSQNQHFNLGTGIGYDPTNSTFSYDGSNVGHYSLAWFSIPGSAEARMSGYGGIKMFTESTPRLTVLKSGLVGIGTTTPDEALVVNGSVAFDYGTGSSYNGIKRNGIKTEYYNGITGTSTNVIHEFTGVNTTILSLTQGGNAGIGTNAPLSRLHIEGAAGGGQPNATVPNYGMLIGGKTTGGILNMGIDANGAVPFYSWIQSRHKSSADFYNLALNPEGGNVGVGTNTPNAKLHLKNGNLLIETGENGGAPNLLFGTSTDPNYAGWGQMGLEYIPNYGLNFWTPHASNNNLQNHLLVIKENGDVGIGTDLSSNTTGFKLSVNGKIRAKEIQVELGWADYVFDDTYKIMELSEVNDFIQKENRLPGVPSAANVENGEFGIGELTKIQQEKIEELMLYTIQQQKELEELKALINTQQELISTIISE